MSDYCHWCGRPVCEYPEACSAALDWERLNIPAAVEDSAIRAATGAYCEWVNGEPPDDDDLAVHRAPGAHIARAVLRVLHGQRVALNQQRQPEGGR